MPDDKSKSWEPTLEQLAAGQAKWMEFTGRVPRMDALRRALIAAVAPEVDALRAEVARLTAEVLSARQVARFQRSINGDLGDSIAKAVGYTGSRDGDALLGAVEQMAAELARLRERAPGIAAEAAAAERQKWADYVGAMAGSRVGIDAANALSEASYRIASQSSASPVMPPELHAVSTYLQVPAQPPAPDRCREALAGLVSVYGVRPRRADEYYPGASPIRVEHFPAGDHDGVWRAALKALEDGT